MKGIIALVHGGKSFINQIKYTCDKLNLELYVISSKIADPSILENMKSKCSDHRVVESSDLNEEQCLSFLHHLIEDGKNPVACISVWENYRSLMAVTNGKIGNHDMPSSQVSFLRDKYLLRKKLNDSNLSTVETIVLDSSVFNNIKEEGKQKFIKPRQGIASFGAFKLKNNTQWEHIINISDQIKNDEIYQSSFTEEIQFIAEDYIPGTEYCFEIINNSKNCHIIAIHEKLEVGELNGTTLENVSITPPVSLSKEQIKSANHWVSLIFASLELGDGCFHLEAKCSADSWEIIEINPRIGGAFINESVANHSGYSLLELWISSLIDYNCKEFEGLLNSLNPESECFFERRKGSFFRVFFAEPSKSIKKIKFNSNFSPIQKAIFMQEGQETPDASRELFMAQALWSWDISKEAHQIKNTVYETQSALEVDYE
ncbi:ATP-grasp domain-containing protein [Photobacterium sp. SP02]|uniref:ATP-grasp domain-containing protein n=1 Tax=Photobacterium sp. SP02 TaxID=3032280 RepID=UPI00314514FD